MHHVDHVLCIPNQACDAFCRLLQTTLPSHSHTASTRPEPCLSLLETRFRFRKHRRPRTAFVTLRCLTRHIAALISCLPTPSASIVHLSPHHRHGLQTVNVQPASEKVVTYTRRVHTVPAPSHAPRRTIDITASAPRPNEASSPCPRRPYPQVSRLYRATIS